jgi:pilus assembly protein CpaF
MDARLPDGSRVHVIVPPSARNGCCISIRKFKKSTFNLASLVHSGSISEEAKEFLGLAVLLHKNMVIAGGTGSGKTSLLNALSAEIPEHERIVVIEDSSELQLHQPHTVYLEAQPERPDGTGRVTIRDLFVDSLRMRPDRIVVGEIRRGEALDLIQSMISGHAGSLTTVHATTAYDAAVRLETLSLMSDVALPVHVARMRRWLLPFSSWCKSAGFWMVLGRFARSASVWVSIKLATTALRTSTASRPAAPTPMAA